MAGFTRSVPADDLSGSESTTRVVFPLGRHAYRIDLDDGNAEAFESAMRPYLRSGRVIGQVRLGGPKPDRRRPSDPVAVRDWAERNGIYVSGPDLPGDVIVAYNAWQTAVSAGLLERRHAPRESAAAV